MDGSAFDQQNRDVLRWTLSAASWMYALWTAVFGWAASALPGSRVPAGLLLGHALLLAAAGFLLAKPRRGAWTVTALAGLGSLGFVAFDLREGGYQAAAIDATYPALALLLGLLSRPLRRAP